MLRYQEITDTYVRYVVLAVGAAKLIAWWYLFSLVVRFHVFGMRDIFARMVPLMPSAAAPVADRETDSAAISSGTPQPGGLEPPDTEPEDWRARSGGGPAT
jgi:hypothetical protein